MSTSFSKSTQHPASPYQYGADVFFLLIGIKTTLASMLMWESCWLYRKKAFYTTVSTSYTAVVKLDWGASTWLDFNVLMIQNIEHWGLIEAPKQVRWPVSPLHIVIIGNKAGRRGDWCVWTRWWQIDYLSNPLNPLLSLHYWQLLTPLG